MDAGFSALVGVGTGGLGASFGDAGFGTRARALGTERGTVDFFGTMDAGFGALGVSIGGLGARFGLALGQSVMRPMHSRCRQWNRGVAV
jgi:hypothetical protein